MSVGPCFRPQDSEKPYHQGQFFKIELINILSPGTDISNKWKVACNLVETAREVMKREVPSDRLIMIVRTNEGFDLELNGLEIGSYGARSFKGLTWEYGTGLAEPRFTQALNL